MTRTASYLRGQCPSNSIDDVDLNRREHEVIESSIFSLHIPKVASKLSV